MVQARALAWFLGGMLAACTGGSAARRDIEMVPLPPPSATPEPVEPAAPPVASASPTSNDSSSIPRALPRPTSVESDAGAPPTSSGADDKAELQSAIANTGWKLVGAIRTTREGAFEVHVAEVKKGAIRGRVRLVAPHGEATTDDKVPFLPTGANPGVIVEIAAGKGAEAYFYDLAKQTLGRVELRSPGDRREAGDLLRACFPFVH